MSYLLDTNVISELRKGRRCDPGVAAWFAGIAADEIYLSALTIGEIRKGIESIRLRDSRSAAALETWLEELVTDQEDRILAIDRTVAEEWGRLAVPDPLPVVDGLLAATARVHRLTLATRNVKDVERTGVTCLNPFAG